MVKNILTLSMVASLALFTVGCGGGGSNSTDNNNAQDTNQTADTVAPQITNTTPVQAVEDTNKTITLTANEPASFAIDPATHFDLNGTTLTFEAPSFDPNGGNEYNVTVKATDAANNVGTKVLSFDVVEKTYTATAAPVSVGDKALTKNPDGTVEGASGLLWQDNSIGDKTPRSYADAVTYCTGLGNGWRVPLNSELLNVLDFTKGNHDPANSANLLEDEFNVTLGGTPTTVEWTEEINGTKMAVNYATGTDALETNATAEHPVKCVKGAKAPAHTFITENNITIDQATQLKWTSIDNANKKKIEGDEAATYCTDLATDGGNWRLPNINELRSLVTNNSVPESIAPAGTTLIWSSTEYTNAGNNNPLNYTLDLRDNVPHLTAYEVTEPLAVTCVKKR